MAELTVILADMITWTFVAACLVAGMIGALAWRDRDRTSRRFASAESSDDL